MSKSTKILIVILVLLIDFLASLYIFIYQPAWLFNKIPRINKQEAIAPKKESITINSGIYYSNNEKYLNGVLKDLNFSTNSLSVYSENTNFDFIINPNCKIGLMRDNNIILIKKEDLANIKINNDVWLKFNNLNQVIQILLFEV